MFGVWGGSSLMIAPAGESALLAGTRTGNIQTFSPSFQAMFFISKGLKKRIMFFFI